MCVCDAMWQPSPNSIYIYYSCLVRSGRLCLTVCFMSAVHWWDPYGDISVDYKYFDVGSLYPYVESFVISPCVPFSCFKFFQRLSEHLVCLPETLVETCLRLASQSFKWGHISTLDAGSVHFFKIIYASNCTSRALLYRVALLRTAPNWLCTCLLPPSIYTTQFQLQLLTHP